MLCVCVWVSDFQSGQDLLIEQMFHWNVAASAGPFMWYNQLINSFLYPSWLISRNSLISLISQLRRIQERIYNHKLKITIIFGQILTFCVNVFVVWNYDDVTKSIYYSSFHLHNVAQIISNAMFVLSYCDIHKHIILWIIHQCFSLS